MREYKRDLELVLLHQELTILGEDSFEILGEKKISTIKCYNELINRYSHKRYKLETRARDKDHPQEKEMQKSKMAVWGGLT